jgi:ferredoxin
MSRGRQGSRLCRENIMAERPRTILICSCEDTMPLAGDAVRKACRGAQVIEGRQFCRSELERFRNAAGAGDPILVACTQETPVFVEAAEEMESPVSFVNIRENAGWSSEAKQAGPKMAALIAAALEEVPDVPTVELSSEGTTLIYGRDERALEAAKLLADHLDITVLLTPDADLTPPRVTSFPIARGKIRSAKGVLGAFEVTVDQCAMPQPSSRSELKVASPRDGMTSHCDILLDLSGGTPLFPAADLRDGYLRADPGDPAAALRAVLKARDLTGTFEKPRHINFTADLCAHSRSKIIGCHRCLDLCPTGAITPNGDHVAIDAKICAGCGQCAAACPTGAAAYAVPPSSTLLTRLRTLLGAYAGAGGEYAVILFHDGEHGAELIDALARYGDGLPANVLPVAVNEITQIGLDAVAASFAYGATAVRFLTRAKPKHDLAGLYRTIALAEPILMGLGFAGPRIATIETDDPDALASALRGLALDAAPSAASFMPLGRPRELTRLALRELHGVAPQRADIVPLPAGAPFGTVVLNTEGCTLCLSCVSACPTGALSSDPDRPMLRFTEDACVQCGLCQSTCPEKVIALQPQIDFRAATAMARVLKQEEPYECIRCGKAFGVKSSVERVIAKLEGKHWMFANSKKRLDVIRMCEDCRVNAMAEEQFDPFGAPPRPAPRTTDDFLRARDRSDGEKGN